MLGRKRGCLGRSGVVDLERTSKILVTELRQGTLGRLTLETPNMMEQEKTETARFVREKEEKKKEKDAKRKKRFQAKQRAQRKAREHRR